MERKRENPNQMFSGIVADSDGRIVGRYESRGRELLDSQLKIVRDVLLKISKQTKGEIPMSEDMINMVWIAGFIRTLKRDKEAEGFILVDVGKNSRYIPCTIYDSKQLSEILGRFAEGEYIKLKGFARSWSTKKGEHWHNGMDIRITEINNPPDVRRKPPVLTAKATGVNENDTYPF